MIWDELDCRLNNKQQTVAQYIWESLQDFKKSFQGDYVVKLRKRTLRVWKAAIKVNAGCFEESKIRNTFDTT